MAEALIAGIGVRHEPLRDLRATCLPGRGGPGQHEAAGRQRRGTTRKVAHSILVAAFHILETLGFDVRIEERAAA